MSNEPRSSAGPEPPGAENSGRWGTPSQKDNGVANRSKLKDWAVIAISFLSIVALLIGGMQWVVSSTIAPIIERLDQIDKSVQKLDKLVNDEFRAVRAQIVNLRERLARVESLLERPIRDREHHTLGLANARRITHP